jgi:hypothetical protein
MAMDGSSLASAAEEERDLFEMANLYPRTTGLPVTVWVSPRGGARHDVRVKVSRRAGDRMELDDTASVAVRPLAHVVAGDLSVEIERPVLRWVSMNADALVDYWEGRLDTIELGQRLKRVA